MKKLITSLLAVGLGLAVMTGPVSATKKDDDDKHKVTICHAKPADTAKNGYVKITVDVAAAGYKKSGHQSEHDADIIPPYEYDDFSYSGKNWDAEGQAIWRAGCRVQSSPSPTAKPTPSNSPKPKPTPSPSNTPTPTPTVSPSDTPTASPTESSPATSGPSEKPTLRALRTLPPTDTADAATSDKMGSILLIAGGAGLAVFGLALMMSYAASRRRL